MAAAAGPTAKNLKADWEGTSDWCGLLSGFRGTLEKTNRKDIADGKMEIVEASVEELPFSDSSFDKIVTVESFYFWPDPEENLKEVYRVLAEDRTFLLVADIYREGGAGRGKYWRILRDISSIIPLGAFQRTFRDSQFCGDCCPHRGGH